MLCDISFCVEVYYGPLFSLCCCGAGLDASDVGRVSGICVAGRLFGLVFVVGAFIGVA